MIAYFDCFSGISGDMTLGAFIDLGVPVTWLQENLAGIPLSGFDLSVKSLLRHGIQAKRVEVRVDADGPSRDYKTIASMIKKSPLTSSIKQQSFEIFEKIADAEALIHECPKENVHFHEVGGVDAIVDIVGTALCVDYLGIRKVIASPIPLGKGFISCSHGTLPVPAPATLGILKGVPVYGTNISHELVTPTGAAIIVTLAESFESIPEMIIEKTGYGAGERDLNSIPNVLRIITGKALDQKKEHQTTYQKETIVVLETSIDNMNPEIFGFLMERLFEKGALDVYWIPVYMKKNRPGTMVQVLCRSENKDDLMDCILSETSSLGVRFYDVKRRALAREKVRIKTDYGEIEAKRIIEPGGGSRIIPEYEVCKKIAFEKNIPIRMVYDTILAHINQNQTARSQ